MLFLKLYLRQKYYLFAGKRSIYMDAKYSGVQGIIAKHPVVMSGYIEPEHLQHYGIYTSERYIILNQVSSGTTAPYY